MRVKLSSFFQSEKERCEEELRSLSLSAFSFLVDRGGLNDFLSVVALSPCFKCLFWSHPLWIQEIFTPEGLSPKGWEDHWAALEKILRGTEVLEALRTYKQKEHLRIGVRDLLSLGETSGILEELSRLADAVIEATLRWVEKELQGTYGVPMDPSGNRVPFAVIGLGKLGGVELNFDSDVDLIYVYGTEKGKTAGPRVVDNHQYFVRLSEALTRALSAITPQGQIYKVDLRLRPEGDRGDIVLPLRSYEIYYESWGETWERAALIKARPVAGDGGLGQAFLETVRPFVYRKYLDFKALDEIRELKLKIDAQAKKKAGGYDVKLGYGGIREIEFVTQAIQLIYGGRDPWIREPNTLRALHRILGKGLLSQVDYHALTEAYVFLRRLENRLQMVECLQTHTIPAKALERERIAHMMGYGGDDPWSKLAEDLERRRGKVHAIFERFFSPVKEEEELVYLEDEELERVLIAHGFRDLSRAMRNIKTLAEGKAFEHPSPETKGLFSRLFPILLEVASKTVSPDWALDHLEALASVQSEGRRTFYAFLLENGGVLDLLLKIFGSSAYLAHHLIAHPELMDYLADPAFLYSLSPLEEMEEELERDLESKGIYSFAAKLDELRRWKHREILRIGMGDLFAGFPLQKITHMWTKVADVVVRRLWAWSGMEGMPLCLLALGKWGGRELTYHSDLDMIFISREEGVSFNAQAVDLVRSLSSVTAEGTLFKVDLRLRPHGSRGEMIYPLKDFLKYMDRSAQLWERQAMIKVRPVAGEPSFLEEAIDAIQERVYQHPLPSGVARKIWDMRLRMEKELASGDPYHIKYSPGGLVDLEFLVQYWQLLWGGEYPKVRKTSTLGALVRMLLLGLVDGEVYKKVREGYLFLRRLENRLRVMYDVPSSTIPKSEKERDLLARSLGFSRGEELVEAYRDVTGENRRLLREVLVG